VKTEFDTGVNRWISLFPRVAGASAITVGLAVTIGWIRGVPSLNNLSSDMASMSANTALTFVLTGLLLLFHSAPRDGKQGMTALILACLVGLNGLLSVVQHVLSSDAGIDQLLFNGARGTIDTFLPGRMPIATAVNFCLFGLSLLALKRRTPLGNGLAQVLALSVGLFGMLGLLEHMYSLSAFDGDAVHVQMALDTAVMFIVLSVGMICLQPDVGVMVVIREKGSGGFMARRLIVAAVGVPVVLGWLVARGEITGLYGPQFGDVLAATAYMGVFVFLVWNISRSVNSVDAEREQLQQLLLRSEKQFKEMFDDAPVAYHELDREGRITRINQTELRLLGYRADEIQGHLVWEFLADQAASQESVLAKLSGRKAPANGVERIFRRKDQSTVSVLSEDRLMFDANGFIVGIRTTLQDLTELMRAQELLHHNEKIHRTLLQNLGEGVGIVDSEERFMLANRAGETIFGVSSGALVGRNLQEFMTPHGFEMIQSQTARRQNGETSSYETEIIRPDGEKRYLIVTASPFNDSDGTTVGSIGVFRDLTERKRVEDALLESEAHYRAVAESANEAIITVDSEGNITGWNQGAERIFGFAEIEVRGKSISVVLPSRYTERHINGMTRVRMGGGRHIVGRTVELEGRRKDGSEFPLELSLAEWMVASKLFFTGIIRDISDRKMVEAKLEVHSQELIVAREKALEASRLKSEFVANMSHEIRTPMNGIIGITGLLLETHLTPEQREFAEIVRQSGDALLTVVNDILDFSKIESGKLSMEIMDFDLIPVVEGAVELFAQRAREKGLELGCLLGGDVLHSMRGDSGRVRQVLTNLIGNAIKFTEKGEIAVSAVVEEETEHGVMVRFTVSDTGIGISEEGKHQLFQPFSQADGSMTRRYGGTGLGLSISKTLVEMMGGAIGFDSEPGKGSTFWWTATFQKQPATAVTIAPHNSLAGVRCLVVTGSNTYRTVVHHYITSWGLKNGCAGSGSRALELLKRAHGRGEPYDLAILDMQMPDMDGNQLASAIHADPNLAATRLIRLMRIGDQYSPVIEKPGFSANLAKPIRQSRLFDCIANVMADTVEGFDPSITAVAGTGAKSTPESTMVTSPKASARDALRILVVEDNVVNQKVAVRMLEKLGYTADVASDGSQAVAAVSHLPYDIIFMDCQMPEMDGFEATVRIRTMEGEANHTTIVAMTANSLQGDREKCLAAGMDDYMSKPIRRDVLAAAIDRSRKSPLLCPQDLKSRGQ
jgi:PAS domain S-box-containing protein